MHALFDVVAQEMLCCIGKHGILDSCNTNNQQKDASKADGGPMLADT
jgi:hypothetical protein